MAAKRRANMIVHAVSNGRRLARMVRPRDRQVGLLARHCGGAG